LWYNEFTLVQRCQTPGKPPLFLEAEHSGKGGLHREDKMSINFTNKKPEDFGVVDKPQSDLEKFIDLYKSVGIELEVKKSEPPDEGVQMITIEVNEYNMSKSITGYNGFYTNIYFDESGKFIQQGIWE